MRVGVADDHELVARPLEPDVEALRLAAVDLVSDDLGTRVARAGLLRGSRSRVRGAVVQDEHFELGVLDREHRRDAACDHLLLVVSRDEHRQGRPAARRRRPDLRALVAQPEDEAAGNPEGRRHGRVQGDEEEHRDDEAFETHASFAFRSSRRRRIRANQQIGSDTTNAIAVAFRAYSTEPRRFTTMPTTMMETSQSTGPAISAMTRRERGARWSGLNRAD